MLLDLIDLIDLIKSYTVAAAKSSYARLTGLADSRRGADVGPRRPTSFQRTICPYSREQNRFPVLQSALFSPHGPRGKGPSAMILAFARVAV